VGQEAIVDETDKTESPASDGAERKPYEPPKIAWREPYEPVSSGFSCAKQPGNPGCGSGPFTG